MDVETWCFDKLGRCLDLFFLKSNRGRNYINWRFDFSFYGLKGCYFWYDGFKFCFDKQLLTISQVLSDYRFQDIRDSDIVLDIGANIGGFSLLASRKAKQVFAVEPLFADLLRANIEINGIKNIAVMEVALGTGKQK